MKAAKRSLNENTFILVFSTIIVKIISAVFKISLANEHFLGDLGFGYFSIAHDIFMPFYMLAISGLPSSVSQLTAEYLAKNQKDNVVENFCLTKKLYTLFGIVFSLAVSLVALALLFGTQSDKNSFPSIIAIVPAVFLCFIISLYRGYFEGFKDMRPTAVSKMIEAAFKLFLGLAAAYAVMKKSGDPILASAAAMFAVTIGTFFSAFYLIKHFKRKNPIDDNFYFKKSNTDITAKSILSPSVPFILTALSLSMTAFTDVLTVKMFIANATPEYLSNIFLRYNIKVRDVSTYLYSLNSKAFTLYYLVPTITMSLGISYLPVLREYCILRKKSEVTENIVFALKLVSVITFPLALGMIFVSRPIMNLIYSTDDVLSSNLLSFYGFSALFAGFATPLTAFLQAINCQKSVLKTVVVGIIIKITVNSVAVRFPNINIFAAPFGTVLCYLYISVTLFVILIRNVKSVNIKNTFLMPLVSAALSVMSAILTLNVLNGKIFTLFAICIAGLVYFICLFLTGTFKFSEIKNFFKKRITQKNL